MTELKRTQVKGERYLLPEEEVRVQRLISKGLTLDKKIRRLQEELEDIKQELTEIATSRREGKTTVDLKAVSGDSAKITFRESYEASDQVEALKPALGSLWERFFTPKKSFKTTKDLKRFLVEGHGFGIEDPEPVKAEILKLVKLKVTKPNVKIQGAE